MKKVLTIAGSDCSGGAGIQADIKTITAHRMYAMSAITALTAQNTTGVYGISEVPAEFVAQQLDCIFTDIRPDSVKIGMVYDKDIIKTIAEKLAEYKAENIVIDTVMISSSGRRLLTEAAEAELVNTLLPIGTIITPNLPEAEALCGFPVKNADDMLNAAEKIAAMTDSAVLVKGGHLSGKALDILLADGKLSRFEAERIYTKNTHGTGCTLSSAIACGLAKGYSIEESVEKAKDYLTKAIETSLDIGRGAGPLNHLHSIS